MVRNKKIFHTFFRDKPAMMLITLLTRNNELYASSLAKIVDCTYSHVVKILHEMGKSNLICFEKKGRLKMIKLTEKGTKIATHFEEIRKSL